MMKRIEDMNFYELLEVSQTATSQEIHKAYERIRRVYEPNSVALYSLFTPDETAIIYQRVEEAYRTLVYEDNRRRYDLTIKNRSELPEFTPSLPSQALSYQPPPIPTAPPLENLVAHTQEAPTPQIEPAPPSQEKVSPVSQLVSEFTGPAIKVLREQRGLTLRNVSDATKVGARYLEYIEEENFSKLPARAYIRGFLMLYAKALGCEPERMTADYLKRYEAAMNPPKK